MSEIRIVDAALVPDRPAGPARGRLIIFGTLMACLISIAVAHIKAEWGALEEDDPRKLLAGEIRGFIPRSTFKRMEQ